MPAKRRRIYRAETEQERRDREEIANARMLSRLRSTNHRVAREFQAEMDQIDQEAAKAEKAQVNDEKDPQP
ncbi:hypothetical protein GCM10027318_34220 [Massilia agilis]